MRFASKLVSTRRGTLLTALMIAVVAGASIMLYLNSYRESVQAEGALVTVLVASDTIPKGTSGTVVAAKDLYTVTTIRESQLLEGAISDPATLRDMVAKREIFEGAQLTISDFGPAGKSLAAPLTERQRVVSLPFDSAHGMIDALEVGNRVDVFAAFAVNPIGRNGMPIMGSEGKEVLRLILSDVPVVAVGESARGGGTTTVSLRVDDLGAADAAFGAEFGRLWLALRPSAGAKPSRPDIVTVETLLLGVPPRAMLQWLGGVK